MMNMYFGLTNKVTIIPIDNDIVYTKGKTNTYDLTNNIISENVHKMLDFEHFLGTPKSDGIGTLDRKEFHRITGPSNGFLSYSELDIKDFSIEKNPLNTLNSKTAKQLIIMFKTKVGESVDMDVLENLNDLFPTQIRIICESQTDEESKVVLLLNGLDVPEKYAEDAQNVISNISALKVTKKERKKANKKIIGVGKKGLFNI